MTVLDAPNCFKLVCVLFRRYLEHGINNEAEAIARLSADIRAQMDDRKLSYAWFNAKRRFDQVQARTSRRHKKVTTG